jgi:Tfp pilus assembly protein PilX
MRTVIIWMFILLSVPSLMAQKVFSQKELDAVLNPVLMEHAEEMLRFEHMEINAGTLSEDDKPQVFTFTCTNVGKQKIVVTKISTTCGCTNAHIDSPVINPGENMGSMYSHKSTGSFEIEEDEDLGYILTGEYDYSHNPLKEYIVSEMTDETMKWTVKDNAEDVSVYTRCAEIPEDILNGSRSLK